MKIPVMDNNRNIYIFVIFFDDCANIVCSAVLK